MNSVFSIHLDELIMNSGRGKERGKQRPRRALGVLLVCSRLHRVQALTTFSHSLFNSPVSCSVPALGESTGLVPYFAIDSQGIKIPVQAPEHITPDLL